MVATDDPDFPHGAPLGYFRGCRCADCRKARQTHTKLRDYAAASGRPYPTMLTDAAPARTHLFHLLRTVPGASLPAVAKVCGMTSTALVDLHRGRSKKVTLGHEQALLATTPEDVRRMCGFRAAEEYRVKLRRLQAAGWSLGWLAMQTGRRRFSMLDKAAETDWITAGQAQEVDELVERIGTRLATPENSGQPSRTIKLASAQARARGFHPPGCYNPDGTINPRYCPEHPWAQLDERAGELLGWLECIVKGEPVKALAARLGLQEKVVNRVVAATGLQLADPNRDANLARVRDVLEVYAYDPESDPVYLALTLGVLAWRGVVFPQDHPGFLAWQRDRAAAEAAA